MATIAYLKTLYAYDAWANARVLDTAARLDPPSLDATPLAGLGSLREIFTHTVGALWIWRSRLEGVSPPAMLDPAAFPDLAAIRERWRAEEEALSVVISRLNDAAMAEDFVYKTTTGKEHRNPLWQILVHLANHGTQHRSEAAALLTSLGASPGNLDMIFFFREATLS